MKLYDEIAKIAHELYEKSGKAEGRDLDNWLEAERIVMARSRYGKQEKSKEESSFSLTKKKTSSTIKASKTKTKAKKTKE